MVKNNLSNSIQKLDWDSRFFGYSVGKITDAGLSLEEVKNLLLDSKKKFKLIYWFLDPKFQEANKTARGSGGSLVDKKVTYLIKVPRNVKVDKIRRIESCLKKPLNPLLRFLALKAGVYSRYRVDPNFENGEFEKLYTEWIKKSLRGEIAKDVLVYRIKNKEVGFVSLGDKNGRCNIGLIATKPEYRGKKIGKKLVEAAFKKALDWGYKEMDVVTQEANRGACRFYEKMGFKLESKVNIYHFWL